MEEARETAKDRLGNEAGPGNQVRDPALTALLTAQPILRAGALYAGMKRALAILETTPPEPSERALTVHGRIARGDYSFPFPQLAERMLQASGLFPAVPQPGPGSTEEAEESEDLPAGV